MLAVEERRVEIEVGLGFEGVLPDAKCGRLLDRAVVPALKRDEWKAGIFGGAEALLAVMAGEDFDTAVGRGESTMGTILKWAVVAGFIGIPLWAMFKGRKKDGEDGDDDPGEDSAGEDDSDEDDPDGDDADDDDSDDGADDDPDEDSSDGDEPGEE